MKTQSANLRINILGAKGVGKSAITVRYLTKRFIGEYSSGLDISYQTSISHDGAIIKVDILDISNQSECQAVSHDVYDADAFVVVYSIADEVSLNVAKKEVEKVRSRSSSCTRILLLGNKLDLDHARKVSREEIDKFVQSNDCQHAEVSAAEGHIPIINSLQNLLVDTFTSLFQNGRLIKRRKSLFENVSKKLGNVFRRRSLEDTPVSKKIMSRISYRSANRRSV